MYSFRIVLSTITLMFFATINYAQSPDSKTFALGVVEELYSFKLSEKRTLNIFLPEAYSNADTQRYPVIYLLDGSADEDFIHVAGLIQFNSFPWIKRIPKSILVGIANVDRRRDFTYPTTIQEDIKANPTAGHSDKFIAFIENELQPFMDRTYKTNTSKTLIGESLGGLLATEILLKKPLLFHKYIIISPSLWWDNGTLLHLPSPIFEEAFSQKTDIYIGVGKEGLTPGKFPRVMEVDANLLADKLMNAKGKNVNAFFDYLPQENHATIGHQAILNSLIIFSKASKEPK